MKKRIMTVCLLICIVLVIGCGSKEGRQKTGDTINSTEMIETTELQLAVESTEMAEYVDDSKTQASSTLGRIVYPGQSYVWEEIHLIIPQE